MTISQPNPDVNDTGAEIEEFIDAPMREEDDEEQSTTKEPDPEASLYSTVPLEDEDGNEYVIQQQNVGEENMRGGGEWPDPDAPPQSPAPGSAPVER